MKIVRPYAKLLPLVASYDGEGFPTQKFERHMGIDLLKRIEWASRISHRSEESVTTDSWQRIIQSVVLDHGDWSVVEHATVSVDMVVDRGITHEWVRHRLFGFTQESTRFVNYKNKMPPSFIYPQPGVDCEFCLQGEQPIKVPINNKARTDSWVPTWVHPNHGEDLVYATPHRDEPCYPCVYGTARSYWLDAIHQCEVSYKGLLMEGWRPQEARSIFPNALVSRIVTTGNLRNWRHVLIMRTTDETHPQMKQVMIPLLAEFKKQIPLLFDDIEPNMKQSLAIKKAR